MPKTSPECQLRMATLDLPWLIPIRLQLRPAFESSNRSAHLVPDEQYDARNRGVGRNPFIILTNHRDYVIVNVIY